MAVSAGLSLSPEVVGGHDAAVVAGLDGEDIGRCGQLAELDLRDDGTTSDGPGGFLEQHGLAGRDGIERGSGGSGQAALHRLFAGEDQVQIWAFEYGDVSSGHIGLRLC